MNTRKSKKEYPYLLQGLAMVVGSMGVPKSFSFKEKMLYYSICAIMIVFMYVYDALYYTGIVHVSRILVMPFTSKGRKAIKYAWWKITHRKEYNIIKTL